VLLVASPRGSVEIVQDVFIQKSTIPLLERSRAIIPTIIPLSELLCVLELLCVSELFGVIVFFGVIVQGLFYGNNSASGIIVRVNECNDSAS
jgi:hypothetical protein